MDSDRQGSTARKTGRRLWLIIIALMIVSLLAWCAMRPAEQTEAPQASAIPVQVYQVETRTLHETVRGIGDLRAPQDVVISPEAAGRVKSIHFEEGSIVEAGQVLVELEDEKLRSQMAAREAARESAQVRLANVRRTYQRQEKLVDPGLVSEQEFETARAELDSAAAEVARLEAELAFTRTQLADSLIRAPFKGAISERLVDPGAFVAPGDPLAHLFQLDPLELSFSVPERFAGRVHQGQAVQATTAAWPDEQFDGLVVFVAPVIDPATRTLAVKAELPNPEGRLKPGAFATALVTVGTREDRPVVPEDALVATRSGYQIYLVENGQAHARPVQTGLRRGGIVEITEGLAPGDVIVQSGHMRLNDGSPVEIVEDERPGERSAASASAATENADSEDGTARRAGESQ